MGRFLQPDPIGYEGGDFNLYTYVKNSPLNLVDPMGLVFCSENPWHWLALFLAILAVALGLAAIGALGGAVMLGTGAVGAIGSINTVGGALGLAGALGAGSVASGAGAAGVASASGL